MPEFVAAAGPNDETTESWNARGPWRAPVPIGGRHSLRLAPAPVSLNVGQLDRMVQAKIASFASRDADGRRQILRMFQKSARLACTSSSTRQAAATSSHGLEISVNEFNVLLNEILNIPTDLASCRALFERYDTDGSGSLAAAELAAAVYPEDYANSTATGSTGEARPVPVGSAQNSRAMASFLAPLKPLRGAPGFVSRTATPAQGRPWSGMMPPQQSTESTARPEQHHFSRPPSSQTHWTLSHVNSIESRQMRQQLQPPPVPTPAAGPVPAATTATPTNSLTTKLSGTKVARVIAAPSESIVAPHGAGASPRRDGLSDVGGAPRDEKKESDMAKVRRSHGLLSAAHRLRRRAGHIVASHASHATAAGGVPDPAGGQAAAAAAALYLDQCRAIARTIMDPALSRKVLEAANFGTTESHRLTTPSGYGRSRATSKTAKDRGSISPRRAEPTNQTNQSAMTPPTPSMPTPPSAPRTQRPHGQHAGRCRGGQGRDHTVQVVG